MNIEDFLSNKLGCKVKGKLLGDEWEKYNLVELPCYLNTPGGCNGCKKGKGLYRKCGGDVEEGGSLCVKCNNSVKEEDGIPYPGGLFKEEDARRKSWVWYLNKFKMDKEDAKKVLELYGFKMKDIRREDWLRSRRVESKETARLIPIKGKRKSPPRSGGNFCKHKTGDIGCVAMFNKETGFVTPTKWEEWSQAGQDKFVEMYGELDENGKGRDQPKKIKKEKKDSFNEDVLEMKMKMAAMNKENEDYKERLQKERDDHIKMQLEGGEKKKVKKNKKKKNL